MSESTALTVAQRATLALGLADIEKTLTEMASKTTSIVFITSPDGYTQVHSGRMALKNQRIAIEKAGKAARDDATKFSKAVLAEEARLIAIIEPEEKRLQAVQDGHDAAVEALKQDRINAELRRVAAIDARIEIIRGWPTQYTGKPSALVEQQVKAANDYVINEFFEEKADTARTVLEASRAALVGILAERKAHEAEQERVKAEREELAKLRAQQAERDAAERARIAEEERVAKVARDAEAARQAAELKAQRDKQTEEATAERARFAAEEAAAKVTRDAEARKLAAERAELERQQEEFRKSQEPIVLETARPTDKEIIGAIASHWSVDEATAIEWILSLDLSERSIAA